MNLSSSKSQFIFTICYQIVIFELPFKTIFSPSDTVDSVIVSLQGSQTLVPSPQISQKPAHWLPVKLNSSSQTSVSYFSHAEIFVYSSLRFKKKQVYEFSEQICDCTCRSLTETLIKWKFIQGISGKLNHFMNKLEMLGCL